MMWYFHSSCHGSNISLRCTASTAIRNPDTFDNGIVFSDTNLQAGSVVSLFFKKKNNRWAGMPRVGFTNQNPDQVNPLSLPAIYSQEVSYQSQTWVISLEKANENIFIDYTFDEMGLVRISQRGWPEKLVDTRGAVNFKNSVWATVDLSGCYTCVMKNDNSTYMPKEIIEQGVQAQRVYIEELSKGSRSVRLTKLVLIGQGGVGKTSVMQKLTNFRSDVLESCAGGIDVLLSVRIDGMRFWHYHGEVRVTSEGKGMAEASGHELPVDGDALLNIWDHTGQDLVDLTHQVVYSHRAIFLFVFNLTHDLDKAAVFEVTGSNGQATEQHELTNLECMNLWMQTVHMYTSTANQFSQRTSPAIIVVGTHRGSLGRETTEQVAAKFSKIRDLLRDAPYRQHVMSRHFAVENSLEDCSDAEIVGLRTLIEDLCFSEDMREEIPLKWLQFEEARLRNPPVMSVAMVRQILQKSIGDFSNAELLTMLKFYHDIGQILFFDGQTEAHPNLMHMGGILADRCWLIKLFRMFIAVPKLKDQSPAFTRSWKRLNEEGILEESLINHLWSGTLNEIQEWHVGDALDTKQALLSLMCKLDLLCERYSLHQRGPAGDQMETSDVQETTERTYFVPTALHKSSVIKRDPQNPASYFIFYVDFKQIVPESLFNRLVVHALAWSQTQDGTEQLPRIAYRYVCFPADGDHDVEMEMSPLKQAHIKVCVSKHAVVSTSARGPTRLIKSQSTPSPLVMCKVKDFLVATFDAIKSMSAIGLKFGFSIPCPCDPEGSLHFLPLNDCLEKERIGCQLSGVRIDTMGVKQMFADLGTLPAEILDPYVMSEKHLRAVAAELGPEWQHLAVNLGFNQSNLYRFKHDNSIIDNAIFSMLVTWSHREGQDKGKKLQVLSEAMVACGRRDVVETLLHPYM